MKPQSTILVVDDEPRALALLRNVIEPEGHRVLTAPDGASTLALAGKEHPDAIVLDVMMPDMDGFEVCRRLRATPELATVPILLLTALDDRESKLQGLDAGADDFLTKPFDAVELRIRLRTISRLNRYRRLYEESSRYEAAITHSAEGIVLAELDGTIVLRNSAFTHLVQSTHAALPNFFEYFSTEHAARLRHDSGPAPTLRPTELELLHGRAQPTIVEVTAGYVPWEHRTLLQYHVRDLTEKKNLEAQLLRSQRIELLGQLSGSVVHDMNNILAAIGGSAGLIELDPSGKFLPRHLDNIKKAVQRGAGMLRQLLHFARGSDGPLETTSPAEVAGEVATLVKESFGGHFEVSFTAEPHLPAIRADSTQIHQVLMNLCVNARDAMPDGGALELAVTRRTLTPAELPALGPDVRAGDYVVLTVRDHGTGIPPEVRARLFDPFFTTKPKGKGTGLGLATVLRLVRRHGGFVELETEVGQGTTFHCGFPVA
ncbi:MAG: response regulator [Candidatus Didemnitutus sp.]|nr:response regulator [Candidatus Didemnitutus sp.]